MLVYVTVCGHPFEVLVPRSVTVYNLHQQMGKAGSLMLQEIEQKTKRGTVYLYVSQLITMLV